MMRLFSRLFGKRIKLHNQALPTQSGQAQSETTEPEHGVRIAVYDSLGTIPRIVDVRSTHKGELLNKVSSKAYAFAHDKGGTLPYIAIKEIVENLLHAGIQEAIITILPDGNTIRVSDQGPGIVDKEKAFLPGFTTASSEMKKTVRGVGSGLPIVKDSMCSVGGYILIEDNLKNGCVVTLSCAAEGRRLSRTLKERPPIEDTTSSKTPGMQFTSGIIEKPQAHEKREAMVEGKRETSISMKKLFDILSQRQRKVFMVLAEEGEGGPSLVAKELKLSLSTAYRDLVVLEKHGLIRTINSSGKRELTPRGIAFLPYVTG